MGWFWPCKGFSYDSNTHSIAWEFEAECIIRTWASIPNAGKAIKELKQLEDCVPLFRQEYLKAWWADIKIWGDWLLIRKLKRLKTHTTGLDQILEVSAFQTSNISPIQKERHPPATLPKNKEGSLQGIMCRNS